MDTKWTLLKKKGLINEEVKKKKQGILTLRSL